MLQVSIHRLLVVLVPALEQASALVAAPVEAAALCLGVVLAWEQAQGVDLVAVLEAEPEQAADSEAEQEVARAEPGLELPSWFQRVRVLLF